MGITPTESVIFSGLGPEAFDKNPESTYSIGGTTQYVEWNGDLDNKKIIIEATANHSYRGISFIFLDSEGKPLNSLTLDGKAGASVFINGRKLVEVIVPEGSVKIKVVGDRDASPVVNDIYVGESQLSPQVVTNITSESTDNSIVLKWENRSNDYLKSAVFRDGVFIGFSNGNTYVDTPLYSSQEYTYEIQSINKYGNASSKVTHKTSTITPDIIFRGLDPKAFDKNPESTYFIGGTTQYVEWDGDLNNKKLFIEGTSSHSWQNMSFSFLDITGGLLKSLTLDGQHSNSVNILGRKLVEVIVPEGSVKIKIVGSRDAGSLVNDIYVGENLEVPMEVTNITSESTDSSIVLKWERTSNNYLKTAVYRDGEFIGFTTGKTYTDTPLYSDQEYTYEIQDINVYGNSSSKVTHKSKTTTPDIIFRGLSPSAFDRNEKTEFIIADSSQGITWDGDLTGKIISIIAHCTGNNSAHATMYFKDSNGATLGFTDTEGKDFMHISFSKTKTTYRLVVPEGAKKITFTVGHSSTGSRGYIQDVFVEDNL